MKRALSTLLCLCALITLLSPNCMAFRGDCTNISVAVGNVVLPLKEYPVGGRCQMHDMVYPLPTGGSVYVGGVQCIGFARYVFYRCFGVVDYNDEGGRGYHCEIYQKRAADISVEYLRGILGVTVLAGAHIRASDGHTGHSMVFLSCDDDYIYTYEGNYDHNGGVTVNQRTWEEFVSYCQGKGGIEFIHMPDTYPAQPNAPYEAFTDMPEEDNWAYAGMRFMLENGLFAGTSATTVSPALVMTRAMLVTILWRLEGAPEMSAEVLFTDVEQTDWFAPAVTWAAQENIVSGIGDGRFGPNQTVTREQIAVILCGYVSRGDEEEPPTLDTDEALSSSPDADTISPWATDAVAWAVYNGLISGRREGADTLLAPKAGATRAEVAVIIMRLCTPPSE